MTRKLKRKIIRLLKDYRNQPNCGEYGVTRGWQKRVDKILKKICR